MQSRFPRLAVFCSFGIALLFVSLALAQSANQVEQTPPISLGTSGGNVHNISKRACCSGTLGALVTKNSVDYILSNNHVLADTDTATVGDDISQPGLGDVGCVLTASNSHIVAHFSETKTLGTDNLDAALAEIVSGAVKTDGSILEVGVPSSTSATPSVSLGVAKSGRTTGLTCATIGSVSTNVVVQYQQRCGQGRRFRIIYLNQILVSGSTFSAGGDSGSLIVTQSAAQPVGLLFAGSSTSTVANPISDVTNAFGVSIVGGADHTVSCPATAGTAAIARGQLVGSLQRALLAKEKHAERLMQDEAVIGVGVGADPADPSEAVIVIYLEEGRPHGPIPAELDGVRTNVVRTDAFRAFAWNERKTDPWRVR